MQKRIERKKKEIFIKNSTPNLRAIMRIHYSRLLARKKDRNSTLVLVKKKRKRQE